MPVLSVFYGIIVRMYNEKGGKHNAPHRSFEIRRAGYVAANVEIG